jgi:WD40 repeat protein
MKRIGLLLGCLCCCIGLVKAQNSTSKDNLELVITKGHKKAVVALDYHPSGKYIVTAGQDLSLKIWDLALQQEYRTLQGHKQSIKKVVYSPNGKYIASMSRNQAILWKHPEGTIVKKIKIHNGTVLFSADSKWLLAQGVTASSGFSGNLAMYATATGELIKAFAQWDLDSDGAALHPNNAWLFNKYKWLDLTTGEEKGTLQAQSKQAFWTLSCVSSTYFAAYNFGTPKLHIWALPNAQNPVHTIALPTNKEVKKLAFTPNGKYLVAGTSDFHFYVYKIATGKLLRTIKPKNLFKPGAIRPTEEKQVQQGALYDFALSPHNAHIAANVNIATIGGKSATAGIRQMVGVQLLSLANGKELGAFGGIYNEVVNFSVSRNEKRMTSLHYGAHSGVRIWNLRKGDVEAFIPTVGGKEACSNGRTLVVYRLHTRQLVGYDLASLQETFEIKLQGSDFPTNLGLSANGQVLVYATYQQVGSAYHRYLKFWDISTPAKPVLINQYKLTAQLEEVKLSPNGKQALIKIYQSGTQGWSRVVKSIELSSGKTLMKYPIVNAKDYVLDFVPQQPKALVVKLVNKPNQGGDFVHLMEVNYTNGKVTDSLVTPYEEINSAQLSPDGKYLVTGSGGVGHAENIHFDVTVWNWQTKKRVCVLKGHQAGVRQVWFGARGKKVYSLDDNGVIKVWNFDKCTLAASFISLSSRDYLILNANNYYKTSKSNVNRIAFRYKNKLRTFGQFDLRFNRPDLVLKDLGGAKIMQRMYYKAWKKRIQRAGVTEAQLAGDLHLPEVEIPDKFALPLVASEPFVNIKVKARDAEVPLKMLQVLVNEVPIFGAAGIPLKGKKSAVQSLKIPLNQGNNQVSIIAINAQGLKSVRASFNIGYKAHRLPNLYVLAIGVSVYDNAERNLKFAEKDAQNLTDVLKKAQNYGKVIIKKVLNKAATKANILKAAKVFEQSTVNDQVLIYVSCHGLLDDQMNYYLATTDVDFDNPAKNGLPYEAIEQMLDKVPARRRLIMIDACHSGELDKSEIEVNTTPAPKQKKEKISIAFKGGTRLIQPKAGLNNSFDYMKALFNDVSNQSGATIISAAAGYEFALESKEWNNGVFTYSVMKGLDINAQDKDHADLNSDGKVTVNELKEYVINKVVQLTNGKQVPTTRRENQSVEVVLFVPKE